MTNKQNPIILNDEQTLDHIIKNNMSISRFGDGELINFICTNLGISNPLFEEKFNMLIKKELIEILGNRNKCSNLLIAIYPCLTKEDYKKSLKYDKNQETIERLNYWFFNFFKNQSYFHDYIGNAFCFRRIRCAEEEKLSHRAKVKKHFSSKKILVITSLNQAEVENTELFKEYEIYNINSSNSFPNIDKIEENAKHIFDEGNFDMIVCSAGPVASLLANRFSKKGIIFWDLGSFINRI